MKRKFFNIITLILAAILVLSALPAAAQQESNVSIKELYRGKTIGVQVGTVSGEQAEQYIPDVKIEYFNSQTDLITSLRAKKIDVICTDDSIAKYTAIYNKDLLIEPEFVDTVETAPIFPKTEKGEYLEEQYSEFVEKLWENGTIKEIDDIWYGEDESKKNVLDYQNLPDTNGTLTMAVDLSIVPFAYMKDEKIVGYDVDIAARFCEKYGYRLEVVPMDFSGIIPALLSGKIDFSACCITITPERAESVLFGEPTYKGGTVLVALNASNSKVDDNENKSVFIDVPAGVYKSFDELSGKKIGIQTGTSFDKIVLETIPDAEIVYMNTKADLTNGLQSRKIDGFATDEPVGKNILRSNDKFTYIPDYMDRFEFGYVFGKNEEGEKLRDQFNEFLRKINSDGTLNEIDSVWFGDNENKKTIQDPKTLPNTNGVLRMATEALYEPFSYIANNQIVGYDIDIAVRFCEAYGYGLEIVDMSFDAVLPAVQTGKCNFGGAGITITAERAESVLFSEPNYSGGTVMMVLREQKEKESSAVNTTSFVTGIKSSFEKTFIRESRWKLFVEGVGNTMLITIFSIIFGTILGFLLFMLCRNGNPLANGITVFCLWLVQGMPMVVLLMILFYVIFGNVAISGMTVAIIGFTLTFGASVFGLLKIGVGAIDIGQYEAATALGYSNIRTFFRIILPQAIPHVMGAYKGEIVGLLKATAIVGYIAVQDLTKMGDIVRSRTYEAFFPLIAVTIIYFILEGFLGLIIRRINIQIDPKRRKRETILKGVKTND
ncbi:MAG: transporter substrate-binding domain-containing protein [Anaerolineaceae bacterium]|nr:transporter substrate-binding domain-containing protein [Anaerolineaceae bacterium]